MAFKPSENSLPCPGAPILVPYEALHLIHRMDMTVEDHRVSHDVLVETVGRCLGLLYVNNGIFGSCNPGWIQRSMNILFSHFRSYVLAAKVAESHTMTCQPRSLQEGMLEEAMALKCTSLGDSYRVRLKRQMSCPECGVELTDVSITAHRLCMHRMGFCIAERSGW